MSNYIPDNVEEVEDNESSIMALRGAQDNQVKQLQEEPNMKTAFDGKHASTGQLIGAHLLRNGD